MLTYKMISDDVLEVIETYCSGIAITKISYWYYDIKNWKVSSHGKKDDVPNRDMNEVNIEWVKKYYLPKEGK